MNVAPRRSMTADEFLAWEEGQEVKHEFDGFGPVAMTGVTRAHAVVQGNLIVSLGARLRGGPCRVFGSDLKIKADASIRYPDAFVTCTAGPNASTVVHDHGRNPVSPEIVVFEILSPGTAKTDRITKDREYRATPSIRRYVMLEQDEIAATVFERAGESDEDWIGHILAADAVLRMPEIGVEVPLAELYDGLDPAAG